MSSYIFENVKREKKNERSKKKEENEKQKRHEIARALILKIPSP